MPKQNDADANDTNIANYSQNHRRTVSQRTMTLDDPMSASTATASAAAAAADMTFCMPSYARESLRTMFSMRSHQMLTDVVLEVREEQFHAHKIVLSAASSYFRAMFTGGLRESEMSRVRLQGVSVGYRVAMGNADAENVFVHRATNNRFDANALSIILWPID